MADVQHADTRHARSAGARSQRPAQLHQRRAERTEQRTATLRLPLMTVQVRMPNVHMPQIKMPDLSETAHAIKSKLPSPAQAAYFTGLGLLGVLDVLEWPVVLAVGTGTVIAEQYAQERLARTHEQEQARK